VAVLIYLMDQFTLLFLVIAPAFVVITIFFILFWKMGPQARRLGKANLTKKHTHIVASESGTLDIKVGKATRTGHFEAGKTEAYELIQTKDNPELSHPFVWKGTGVPVFIGASRKSVAVSPNLLTAIEIAEMNNPKKKLPIKLKKWAMENKITVPDEIKNPNFNTNEEESEKNPKKIVRLVVNKLIELNPLKLLWYFSSALDTDAQDVLMDKKYQQGFKDAGKQWMRLGMGLGISLSIGLIALVLVLVASGVGG